jgi:hypothetical protein
MPGTLTEKHTGNELLKKYLATHNVKIASSVDELYLHSVSDDNGEEVDDLLRLRQEWRSEDDDSHRRID